MPLFGLAPKVHVLAQGLPSCGSGCPAGSVGSSNVSLPSGPPSPEGDQEDQGPGDQGHLGVSTVAHGPVVGTPPGSSGGTSDGAPPLQDNPGDPGRLSCHPLPGSSGGLARFRREFVLSKVSHDLDEADLGFLSKHLASGSVSGYGFSFKKFGLFCEQLRVDPLFCPPAVVVKYFRHLYETGKEFSTVNYHRSAVSKFHVGVQGLPMGEHPLVSQAVKSLFRLRSPLPQYRSTF